MRQFAIAFAAGGLTLEGIITLPAEATGNCPMVVLCHPHPALAGSMEHPLLTTISKTLVSHGIGSLRFNFRGVGGSQGDFTNGDQEYTDIVAAVHVAGRWPGVRRGRVALLGYSFGAGVVLRGKQKLRGMRAVVLIAPPPAAIVSSWLLQDRTPKLFLTGGADKISPLTRLQALLAEATSDTELQVVPGANHSWRGQEEEAAGWCVRFLARHLL